MFNERGIEYVGLRELAAVLEMRVSNVTYYFPTKDHLVYELAQELSKANAAVIVPDAAQTMRGFLELLRRMFHNQLRFRCLLLSFVHLMKQNPLLAERYRHTQEERHDAISANIGSLASGGYLRLEADDAPFVVSTLALLSRFWISEAAISFRTLDHEAQVGHYLRLVARLLLPYATDTGKGDILDFLNTLDEPAATHPAQAEASS